MLCGPISAARRRSGAGFTVPTYISTGTIGNGSSTCSPAYPAGLAANDIAILHVVYLNVNVGGPISVTTPSGWTLIDSELINASNTKVQATFWKRLAGTESGGLALGFSPSLSGASGCHAFAEMSIYRGCLASGTPIEGTNHTNGANTTTPTHPSVVTTGPNRMVVSCFGSYLKTTYTPNAAYTGRYSTNPGGGLAPVGTFGLSDRFATISGTVAAVNGACDSVTFSLWGCIGFALLPV